MFGLNAHGQVTWNRICIGPVSARPIRRDAVNSVVNQSELFIRLRTVSFHEPEASFSQYQPRFQVRL